MKRCEPPRIIECCQLLCCKWRCRNHAHCFMLAAQQQWYLSVLHYWCASTLVRWIQLFSLKIIPPRPYWFKHAQSLAGLLINLQAFLLIKSYTKYSCRSDRHLKTLCYLEQIITLLWLCINLPHTHWAGVKYLWKEKIIFSELRNTCFRMGTNLFRWAA